MIQNTQGEYVQRYFIEKGCVLFSALNCIIYIYINQCLIVGICQEICSNVDDFIKMPYTHVIFAIIFNHWITSYNHIMMIKDQTLKAMQYFWKFGSLIK